MNTHKKHRMVGEGGLNCPCCQPKRSKSKKMAKSFMNKRLRREQKKLIKGGV